MGAMEEIRHWGAEALGLVLRTDCVCCGRVIANAGLPICRSCALELDRPRERINPKPRCCRPSRAGLMAERTGRSCSPPKIMCAPLQHRSWDESRQRAGNSSPPVGICPAHNSADACSSPRPLGPRRSSSAAGILSPWLPSMQPESFLSRPFCPSRRLAMPPPIPSVWAVCSDANRWLVICGWTLAGLAS